MLPQICSASMHWSYLGPFVGMHWSCSHAKPCCMGLPAASGDGTARVWDMEIGDCVLLLEGHTAGILDMATAADGSLLVTASEDHTARIWELEKGACLGVLEGHTGAINSVAMDAYGRIAVTVAADGTARVWDLASSSCVHVLQGHAGLGEAADLGMVGLVQCVVCSMTGMDRRLSPEGHTPASVVLPPAMFCNIPLHRHSCNPATMVTALHGHCQLAYSMISNMTYPAGVVWSVALTPDGRRAVTTSEDFTARVWDVVGGTCVHVLQGHSGWVVDVVLTTDASRAITASHDGTAR